MKFSTSGVTTSKTSLLVEDPERDDVSLFVQDYWTLSDTLAITLGLRYSYLSEFDNEVNWRFGITGQYDELYYKTLIGTAYNVPTFREYLKNFGGGLGSNPLEPENMLTVEGQIGYRLAGGDINLTIFRNTYKDFIKEILTLSVNGVDLEGGNGDEYAYNMDKIEIFGLELSGTFYPSDKLAIKISASSLIDSEETPGEVTGNAVTVSTSGTGTSDIEFLNKHMLSIISSYRFTNALYGNANVIYNSSKNTPDNYQQSSSKQQPSNADNVTILNLSMRLQWGQGTTLKLFINNVFDEELFGVPLDNPVEYDTEWYSRTIGISVKANY